MDGENRKHIEGAGVRNRMTPMPVDGDVHRSPSPNDMPRVGLLSADPMREPHGRTRCANINNAHMTGASPIPNHDADHW
jgi:hypothetical protein